MNINEKKLSPRFPLDLDVWLRFYLFIIPNIRYFMGQNKKKEEVKKKEREEKAKLKDVNMAAPSFDRAILNEQHQREKSAKEKERAQPKENAKFDMAKSLFGSGGGAGAAGGADAGEEEVAEE